MCVYLCDARHAASSSSNNKIDWLGITEKMNVVQSGVAQQGGVLADDRAQSQASSGRLVAYGGALA